MVSVLALTACGGGDAAESPSRGTQKITLYTCSSDETVQPVIAAFEEAEPGAEVALFRAPTGELNARIAGDVRSGGLRADVVWTCDPLTMQDYVDQELVGGWKPDNASAIPDRYQTADAVGAHVLYLVAVLREGVTEPVTWRDLTRPDLADSVALPDPEFAASALGAVGYFASADGYGMEYYAALADNGAVQVSSPDEVTTGVAQGVYRAGMTIANSAYQAQLDGSPIAVVWPDPGAVAVHGSVAIARDSADSPAAQDFIAYVVSRRGQTTLAESGSYPTLEGVTGPTLPPDAPIAYPDWAAIAEDKDQLLADYEQLMGG